MGNKYYNGFSLIEVIVAITLLSLIVIFIIPMSIYAYKYNKSNDIRLTSMNLGYNQIEYLKTINYKDLGLNGPGFDPSGVVNEHLYMDDEDTYPININNVEYNILTNIYWESNRSTTGDFIPNATKKVDVSVTARDVLTGKQKIYSDFGTTIAYEGEASFIKETPLMVRAITGENLNEFAKNVTITINKSNNILVATNRTDSEGQVFFTQLLEGNYNVLPSAWQKGDMISRPTGLTGIYPTQNWKFNNEITIKKIDEDFIELLTYVDYPGYIDLEDYDDEILRNAKLTLKPDYRPAEGDNLMLNLELPLNKLNGYKLWRTWIYETNIAHNGDNYYFVEKDTHKLWDGKFIYKSDSSTVKKLDLGIALKDEGKFKKLPNNTIELEIEFTSQLESVVNEIDFVIYEDNSMLSYDNFTISEIIPGRKFKIIVNGIKPNGDNIEFYINDPENAMYSNPFGMRLVRDKNFCNLILQ